MDRKAIALSSRMYQLPTLINSRRSKTALATASDATHRAITPYVLSSAVKPLATAGSGADCAQVTLCSRPKSTRVRWRLVRFSMLFLVALTAAARETLGRHLVYHLQSIVARKVDAKIPRHDIVIP